MVFNKKRTLRIVGISGLLAIGFGYILSTTTVDYTSETGASPTTTNLNSLSESLLHYIKDGRDTRSIQEQLAQISVETLEKGLKTDTQKKAFWINIYNAYIQILLTDHPELYKNRNSFFKTAQIPIAGRKLSFAFIEHGIIRKSQWELGGGYVHKWFTSDFERKLRVSELDYRIHFALNCGAKDCPPVAVYTPGHLEEQLHTGTQRFLGKTTKLKTATKTAKVTSLFSWFRGDFGGKKGTLNILEDFHILEPGTAEKLHFKNYDWTLSLNNFIDL